MAALFTDADYRGNGRVPQYSVWREKKVIRGRFVILNQLDFVCWLFVTAVFDNFKM